MYINTVVSYGNAWNLLVEQHPRELQGIKSAIEELTTEGLESAPIPSGFPFRERVNVSPGILLAGLWEQSIQSQGWEPLKSVIENPGSRAIHLRGLGFKKERVAVSLHRNRELLNRWLYTLAPIATRNGHIDIPVAVVMLVETETSINGRRSMMGAGFERTVDELTALSPLSHGNPFLILGVSLTQNSINVIDLESETGIELRQIVVNRSIEFPLEFHQAGLGILNYFGTVLREKYPDHRAKVKIEQDGLKVRLIIESENGDREIIEKALQEFEMVVRGDVLPEALFDSKAKVLELKNELRIAQVRIDSQRDIIELQGQELLTLRQIIGHSLSRQDSHPISITVNPAIHVSMVNSSNVLIENSLPEIIEHVQELADLAVTDAALQLRLLDMDESLNAVAAKNTPDGVRGSGGIQKLKKFLDEASETGSAVNQFLGKLTDGVCLVQKIAKRYNDIAVWCGAPLVPSILLGSNA
jgi:hypothetical protein